MYLQVREKHQHKYFVDSETRDIVCFCGKEKGVKDKTHKYNAHRGSSSTYNGYTYDSIMEANHAAGLDLRVRAGQIKAWDRQFPVRVDINGYHIFTSKVDFRVHELDGSYTLEEVKGVETPDYKLKKKLIEAVFLVENPEYQYIVYK